MATPQTTKDVGRTRRTRRHLTIAVTSIAIAIGVATALAPDVVIALSRKLVSPVGIYVAAAVRCGIGFALLLIARGARLPSELRLMGFVLVIAGIVFPFFGVENSKARIEWEADHLLFLRLEGLIFILGGLLIYKIAKPPEAESPLTPPNKPIQRDQ